MFLNTTYREYPLVPQKVVDDYKRQDKQIEKKEKLLEDFMKTESTQLGETLALQASRYMKAAWRVTGEPSRELPFDEIHHVDSEGLSCRERPRWRSAGIDHRIV